MKYLPSLRLLAASLFFGFGLTLALSSPPALDFGRLQETLGGRFGPTALTIFSEWRQVLGDGKALGEREKLRKVNDFFNKRIAFEEDSSIWQKTDYWATPLETLGQGRADCEDFSIAKYYSLLALGIPINKLRLVYVRAHLNGPAGSYVQAHMVLAYYATPGAEPLVLDNLRPEILPASQRKDLSPIFSFNSAGLWQGTGNQSSKSNLSRWQDLLSRARAEGFE